MKKTWLVAINSVIVALAAMLLIAGMLLAISRPKEIAVPAVSREKAALPAGAFTKAKEAYDRIGPPFLHLQSSPVTLQLPDLRNHLIYHGRNERPDASSEHSLMHFAFAGESAAVSVKPGEKLYLLYANDSRQKYMFSPNNGETSLWLEASPEDGGVVVDVAMKNEAGEIIRKPMQNARFSLKEKPHTRFGQQRWELGKWKVDGTLLTRQRIRWYGEDLFLKKHGGEEYADLQHKQRLDFGQDQEQYSVYVSAGEALAWKEERWHQIAPGEESQQYPLLVINSADERLLRLELWDVGGKLKIPFNVIKSADTSLPQNITATFKFAGARTRSQLMFEVKNERMLISPQDWLLYLEGKWIKLEIPEQIDAFVDRKISGPLFVIDGIVSEDGRQTLVGTLFNTTRTEMKPIEIPLMQGVQPATVGSFKNGSPSPLEDGDEEEEEEDVPRQSESRHSLNNRKVSGSNGKR